MDRRFDLNPQHSQKVCRQVPGRFLPAVALLWMAALAAGTFGLMRHATAPGASALAPYVTDKNSWPHNSLTEPDATAPDAQRAALLIFVHPQCPCTRATIVELARIMARAPETVQAQVLFYQPQNASAQWAQTGLWRAAAAIPGARVAADVDAREAKRFGVQTSGHALLFSTQRRLVFSGGITQARGHEGENAAGDAVVALANGKMKNTNDEPLQSLVFGCSLQNDTTTP